MNYYQILITQLIFQEMELTKVTSIKPVSPLVEFTPVEETSDSNFIVANTIPMGLDELSNIHTIPVFAKDNESTISHQEFIKTLAFVADQIFGGEAILKPAARVSHPIKGRIPSAAGKPQRSSWNTKKRSITNVWHLR